MEPSLSIIVYGYNEGENAVRTVEECMAFLEGRRLRGEVIFVDDGSVDDTSRRLKIFSDRAGFLYRKHDSNMGIGAAVRTGIAAAGMRWVAALPADGQVPAVELGKMLDAAAEVPVVVSRFPDRFSTADDAVRRFFSAGFHLMCEAFMGGGWAMGGVWLMERREAEKTPFVSETFVANIELPVRLIRKGLGWRMVDLEVRRRDRGASKILFAGRIARVAKEVILAGLAVRGLLV